MYNIKQIFNQEPALVSAAVIDVIGVLELTDIVDLTADAHAGIAMAVTSVLSLFYIRAKTVTKAHLSRIGQPYA